MTARRALRRASNYLQAVLPPGAVRALALRQLRRTGAVEGLTVRVAQTLEERVQALRMLHDAYAHRGIAQVSASGLRVTPHTLAAGTTVFVAVRHGEVIGTISLIEDGALGVPMEATHPQEVARARATGRPFAEVGTLAVVREHRGGTVALLLYNAMYRWARRHRALDDLLIAVHPRAAAFFRHVLLFERTGGVRRYGSLNSALSVPMRLDLVTVPERYAAVHGRPSSTFTLGEEPTTLFHFFVDDPEVEGVEVTAGPADGATSPVPPWSPSDLAALTALDPEVSTLHAASGPGADAGTLASGARPGPVAP